MHNRTPEQKMFIDMITKKLNGLNTARSREKKTETSDTLDHIHCIDSLIRIYENPLYDNKFFDACREVYNNNNSNLTFEAKARAIKNMVLADIKDIKDIEDDKKMPERDKNDKRYNIEESKPYFKNNPDDPNEDPKIESDRIKELEKWAGVSKAQQKPPRKAPASDSSVPAKPKPILPQRSDSAPAPAAAPTPAPATELSNLQRSSIFRSPPSTPPTTPKPIKKTLKCDVVVAAVAPTKETLASLPIQSKRAYVRFGDDLYYVNKARQSCKKLQVDATTVSRFDAALKPSDEARTLKSNELNAVAEMIGNKGHNYKNEEKRPNTPKL